MGQKHKIRSALRKIEHDYVPSDVVARRVALDYSYRDPINGDVCWTNLPVNDKMTFRDVVYEQLKLIFGDHTPALSYEYGDVLNSHKVTIIPAWGKWYATK
jgi:hypothetical protein